MTSSTPPKRILFLDHTAILGGGEIALLHLINALDTRRYHPSVLLFTDGPLVEKLRAAGIDTHILPLDPSVANTRKDSLGTSSLLKFRQLFHSLFFIRRLAKTIRQLRPDLVHTNSLKSDLLGGIAARLARTPVLWHVRDRITSDYLPRSVASLFCRAARHIPQYLVTNSHSTLETLHLPKSFTRNHHRARVIHDGIPDPYRQPPAPPGDTSVPQSLSASVPSPLTVGIVGRISPWKGQHIFLQAAADVLKLFPNTRFQIIGAALFAEQTYEVELHQLVEKLGLKDAVEFTGFRADIPDLINNLDVLVHASTIGEPFGQVIIEGMIASKPVIATNGGGVPEIITPQKNEKGESLETGLLIPMSDAPALAVALTRLLADPALRTAIGARARHHVLSHFTIQKTAAKTQSLYDHLLQNLKSKI